MPEAAEQPAVAKGRSLTGFYVVLSAVVALGLLGFLFWRTWTVWWFDGEKARRLQNAAAAQRGLPVETSVDLGGGLRLELVLIPPGRFQMGSPAKEAGREGDEMQHWVAISRPFYLGKYEVTQEQWTKLMGSNPSHFQGAQNPVDSVTWDDCQEFLKKLNALNPHPSPLPKGEGAAPNPSPPGRGAGGEGFRLPTEAEWEWACRAGTRTRFCSGDTDESMEEYTWFNANSLSTTHPVGEKRPNAWGLFDVHGNVCEWCSDWYGPYEGGRLPAKDPVGPTGGGRRSLRGASWGGIPVGCRSAYRGRQPQNHNDSAIGLRVAMTPAGSPR